MSLVEVRCKNCGEWFDWSTRDHKTGKPNTDNSCPHCKQDSTVGNFKDPWEDWLKGATEESGYSEPTEDFLETFKSMLED